METKQSDAIDRIFERLSKKECGEKCKTLMMVDLGNGVWDVSCESHRIDMMMAVGG